MKKAFVAISLVSLLSACASQDYYQKQEAHNQQSTQQLTQLQDQQSQNLAQCSQHNQQSIAELKSIQQQLDEMKVVNQRTLSAAQKEIVLPLPVSCPEQSIASHKMIIGETEWVFLPGINETFLARIDTGATTSSLNATNIDRFEREGKEWVRFSLSHVESETQAQFELPVKRNVSIVQSSNDDGERRPVVELMITLGSANELTEFTLADRSHLNFPILIGRNFLRDIALVDVALNKTIAKP
ncbi:ATP-dependent zinc protease [Alginatibacterium sediminis]|uniref:ATP-dependent zinc protease n=1 Tax=Alginatibacterium sediminis TaxID=2164068 RepID=A0A420EG11_9ALTE|nr:ATP-dependent zinc protease [Alginatibacterium sediminis]RKF19608.1 ATP-dependent zinc protease [Alginatibacterium sediminis]